MPGTDRPARSSRGSLYGWNGVTEETSPGAVHALGQAHSGVWRVVSLAFLKYRNVDNPVESHGRCGRGNVCFAAASTGACRDAWEGILRDQLDIRHRPQLQIDPD